MHISTVHISDQTIVLAAGTDIPALKALIVSASRLGGGFVEFAAVSRGLISVLVTPHLPVRFETIELPDDEQDEGNRAVGVEDSLDFDIDLFSDQFGL